MGLWRLCGRLALVCFWCNIAAVAQQTGLVVSPSDIGLAVQAGSTTPATATVGVSTPGRSVPFSATVRHIGPTPNWLTITATRTITPANVTLSADGSSLVPGTYVAEVVIATGDGLGRSVSVVLTVGAAGRTVFGVSPSTVTFVSLPGATEPLTQAISISSPLAGAAFRIAATSSGWLSAVSLSNTTPGTVSLSGTTPGSVSVVVNPRGLSAGRYAGAISIIPVPASLGPPTIVPVTLIAGGDALSDRLRPSQVAITVNHHAGSSVTTHEQPVNFYSPVTRDLTATASSSWLTLTSTYNPVPQSTISDFTSSVITVVVNAQGLEPGLHIGHVTFSSTGLPSIEIPVTLRVSGEPVLNVTPSSVVFDEGRGNTLTVNVTSTGSALNFAATASTSTGGNWLSVSPVQGSTAAGSQILTISANTAGLLADSYQGRVVLTTAPGGPTFTILVRLDVTVVTTPSTIFVSPDSIRLSAIAGGTDPIEVLSVGTLSGNGEVFTASATSEGGWLTVDPTSATAPARLRVSADLSKVSSPGQHNALITLTSLLSGQQHLVSVTLSLLDEDIVANPAALSFVQPRKGAEPPRLSLTLTSPTPVRFDVVGKPAWIRMSQHTGTTLAAVIDVWVDRSMLPPGSNTGMIRIAGPKNEVSIPVAYREADPAPATVSPESANLQYQVGAPTLPTAALEVASGGEPGSFSVSVTTESGNAWLRASPMTGNTPDRVELSVDPLLLAPGRHNATVTIRVNNGFEQTRTVPVVLMVGAPSAVVHSVQHGAIQTPGPVGPGQMISIVGTGLGPLLAVTPRPTAAGAYDTKIADTRVLFDNTPAPILFLRNDQINAIVPYAVYGRVSTTMRIEQGPNWSLPIELKVADAVPGVFTVGPNGRGPAVATNADGSTNSQANPAARGSVITFYVTGEGQTDPPGNDGRIVHTDLRRPLLPVTVRIGGIRGEVLYAGSAPMQVSGLMQVNVRVPDDAAAGVVPLEVQVGSGTSQTGVTVAVR